MNNEPSSPIDADWVAPSKMRRRRRDLTGEYAHGSPYDRGSADYWYHRPKEPHWYPNGTGNGERITEDKMTQDEIDEYHLGYEVGFG